VEWPWEARGADSSTPRGTYWGGGFHGAHGPPFPGHSGHYPYFRCRYPWWGYRGYYYGYPWALGWYGGVGWLDANYSYPHESHAVNG
jgi:hypothetical protein